MTALTRTPKLRNWTLLDAGGGVISQGRRVAARNPRGSETYNSHPAIGLTVETLLSVYRQAEVGSPTRQFDLFDDLIERDADARGMYNDRIEDIASWDFEIIPPAGRTDRASVIAAGELNDRLQSKISFRQFMEHQLGAMGDGFACTNLVWDYEDGVISPIEFLNVAPRRFGAPSQDTTDQIFLIDGTTSSFGTIPLQAGLWATTRYRYRNPYAAGLKRSSSWWSFFKLTGFKQFQVWIDMFGLPISIGYHSEAASESSLAALEDAVRGIGEDGYAILSEETELVIKETSRSGQSNVHPMLIDLCDRINTRLITGGTLNTSAGSAGQGSYNLGNVHKSRLDAMKRADARRLEEMVTRDIGTPFVAWNGFDKAAAPRLKIKIPWGDLDRAKALQIIGASVPLSISQMREEFNLRAPLADKDAITFKGQDAPNPGTARQQDG